MIRVPAPLKERIRQAAEANRRSMNGEIVYQLEQVLPVEETKTAAGVSFADQPHAAVRT